MNNILYFNNCWFTNVGEAFIDLGSYEILQQVFDKNIRIATATDMPEWYIENNENYGSMSSKQLKKINYNEFKEKYVSKAINLFDLYDADYFVLSGMFGCELFLRTSASKELLKISKRGTKIIFLGFGGSLYTAKETETVKEYLESLNPFLIVTRDRETYDNYKDIANCISGIDCAFWVKDRFFPKGFSTKTYDIVTFNRTEEPPIYENIKDAIVVRPKHFQYFFNTKDLKSNCMISDSPYDYLTLYANARHVYTDLVHATVISLQYETPVQFFPVDGRANLFASLNGLNRDENGFLQLSSKELEKQKNDLIKRIRSNI